MFSLGYLIKNRTDACGEYEQTVTSEMFHLQSFSWVSYFMCQRKITLIGSDLCWKANIQQISEDVTYYILRAGIQHS